MGLYQPLGPQIDPPYPQGRSRPCGVYRRPDDRVGCEGRVLLEVWDDHGECLFFGSVHAKAADARTEIAAWSWLDDMLDRPRKAVNDDVTLNSPPRLRIL